jgi:broad specificity phosphatase PhoE
VLTLVLTRHGATPRSDPEQHLGQRVDIGLSDQGRAAAARLADRVREVPFDRVISSSLLRARETAEAVVPADRVETDARLMEMDYGRWEGLTYEQIAERDAENRRRWETDPARYKCPDGESGEDVAARVRSFLESIVPSAEEQKTVLAVAHSTTNRILLCVALGVPLRDYRRRFRQDPANLTVLRFFRDVDGGAQLFLANDLSHLRGTTGVTWG